MMSHTTLGRLALAVYACLLFTCSTRREELARSQTYAELRTVRRGVKVTQPGEGERAPYARERLAEGATVAIAEGGLAWLRRDGGATLLLAGPAQIAMHADALEVTSGKLFVDTLSGSTAELTTSSGSLHLSSVRASIDVSPGSIDAYVLQGELRNDAGASAGPGQGLHVAGGKAERRQVTSWDDWTGGLATTDPNPAATPFGVGVVGARVPGATGRPRFALSIQKLEVRVTIDHDLATTEVDEVFFNPTPDTVEGVYKFRAPEAATLHRFGVDRDGELVWGRVKETKAAAAQYQSNVYAGSTEDPALLEWNAPGVYQARLYPIQPGGKRRVVTRYSEWLGRQGERGERRLYVYPMAAEGSLDALPRIEELTARIDLTSAGAREVRAGMKATREGNTLIVRSYDFTPRADLAVELFDDGQASTSAVAYRAKHVVEPDLLAPDEQKAAAAQAKTEADYVLVPVRPSKVNEPPGGLDVAIVVDTSAGTQASSLAIARATATELLAHLGKDDRAAVWASDATLRPVSEGSGALAAVDDGQRSAISAGLAKGERGGATDLGAVITDAASKLDPSRRGIVVYLGDGKPTVGESTVADLRERLGHLARPTRLFALGIGEEADMATLKGLARAGFAERIVDAYGGAQAALRVLEEAERPTWLGVTVGLGAGVDRVYPRELGALFADETALVVGRVTGGIPKEIEVHGSGGVETKSLSTIGMADDGDLKRRWAEGRLVQLLDEGAGRAAVVEVGVRYGVVTPFTSYYVPTTRELASERPRDEEAENKEGGTGTRAKGEEGSMGNPSVSKTGQRFGVAGPVAAATATSAPVTATPPRGSTWGDDIKDSNDRSDVAKSKAPPTPADEAQSFGMIGALSGAPTSGNGPQPSGGGEGGGGRGQGIGLGNIGTIGHGAGTGTGQGFGNGQGRLGGAHQSQPISIRQGPTTVNGRLPPEVVQRIVRQNFGRFRLCYEAGLRNNPALTGRVSVRFVIDNSGAISTATDSGSDLPDSSVVQCVVQGFSNLSFPQPEGGVVTVVYPLIFSPDDSAPSVLAPSAPVRPPVIGFIGFEISPCDAAAYLPLEDRVLLWRERLAAVAPDAYRMAKVYDDALEACEAPTWGERARLLGLMLDQLPTVSLRVALWRSMFSKAKAADILYRGLVARAHTIAELRELHDALGLKHFDPTLLPGVLAPLKTPAARVAKLKELVAQWPDDLELALHLLDAYEDAGDGASERTFARKLRQRGDATASVRTAVGELYLRLKEPDEARRAFGEIVEFAPQDPVARRRLGDLLRSHGFYEEAMRQYETLAKLVPDDPSVWLLLAAASDGLGKVEQAVAFTEKAGASAPQTGSELGRVARETASVYLAWARDEAVRGGRTDEAVALGARARKALPENEATNTPTRVFLTWAHPELRPVLWSNADGTMMPAASGNALLGMAVVSAARKDTVIEIHFEDEDAKEAARLGAEATLTLIYDETAADERIVRVPLTFASAASVRRFRVDPAAGFVEEAVR